MRFEILGEISDIETFATGSGIREIARLQKFMDGADGASAKAQPVCDYPMARSTMLSYIGMRPPGSGARNSR
jgi:hypothetical protein